MHACNILRVNAQLNYDISINFVQATISFACPTVNNYTVCVQILSWFDNHCVNIVILGVNVQRLRL